MEPETSNADTDLVPVAEGTSMAETLFLMSALEQDGIPVAARKPDGVIGTVVFETVICVPRGRKEQAVAIISELRKDAKRLSVSSVDYDVSLSRIADVQTRPDAPEGTKGPELTPAELCSLRDAKILARVAIVFFGIGTVAWMLSRFVSVEINSYNPLESMAVTVLCGCGVLALWVAVKSEPSVRYWIKESYPTSRLARVLRFFELIGSSRRLVLHLALAAVLTFGVHEIILYRCRNAAEKRIAAYRSNVDYPVRVTSMKHTGFISGSSPGESYRLIVGTERFWNASTRNSWYSHYEMDRILEMAEHDVRRLGWSPEKIEEEFERAASGSLSNHKNRFMYRLVDSEQIVVVQPTSLRGGAVRGSAFSSLSSCLIAIYFSALAVLAPFFYLRRRQFAESAPAKSTPALDSPA